MPDSKPARRAVWLALALAILGIAGLLIARNGGHGAAAADATAPASAPPSAASIYDQILKDPEGRPQALGQWKGKLLVLNFWATWCAPCVAEMPALEKAQREYAGRNVVIVGVGTEEPARVREFRDRIGLHDMRLLAGGYDALLLARSLGNTQGVLPYTVLVSADGAVLQTQTGPLAANQLRNWLAAKP
jgi:thiol-disulfide isomerase/thioredoxin